VALNLTKAYEELGLRLGDFPIAVKSLAHIMSLRMFPSLTPGQQKRKMTEVLKGLSVTPNKLRSDSLRF